MQNNSKGVAKGSLHIYGKAADIRVPKHDINLVRKVAIKGFKLKFKIYMVI